MFWSTLQEPYTLKTQEFTETDSYLYSFTYEKKHI